MLFPLLWSLHHLGLPASVMWTCRSSEQSDWLVSCKCDPLVEKHLHMNNILEIKKLYIKSHEKEETIFKRTEEDKKTTKNACILMWANFGRILKTHDLGGS